MRVLVILALFLGPFSADAQNGYFQQQVDFTIRVRLDDESHMLRADERIEYTNNSPDTLTFLYFHLWPNAYVSKKSALAKQMLRLGKTELFFATEEEMGFIDSLQFSLNGHPCLWEYDSLHRDICRITLNQPLLPGGNVIIATPFRVKLPSGSISRLGHIGQSYQITQWYPKPAVYDSAGWHPMPYLTIGEFYSEFGSFDVSITLPENYTVGATGDLQTDSEINRLDDLAKSTEQWLSERSSTNDWSEWSKKMEFPESSSSRKTLRYAQKNVHDFGWFADKRWHVLKHEVKLPASEDKVVLWTMFTNKGARLWKDSPEYMHDAVYYYSLWNGNYPYRQATAVDGTISAGGGMEYPNVTVIGDAQSALMLETVIMHEVGHNWFYGILGSNERRHAWLDEGVNSYNEQRYLSTKYPKSTLFSKESNTFMRFSGMDAYGLKDMHYFTFLALARPNRDQKMNTSSEWFQELNYGAVVYSKSAVFLNYLRHSLGDSLMDAAMHHYFEENKFKHPSPESFENALEHATSRNLDWFFKDVVNSTTKLDYRIAKASSGNGRTVVRLKNKTGLAAPVYISLQQSSRESKGLWVNGFRNDTTLTFDESCSSVEIDPLRQMPEVNRFNNRSRTRGVFRKVEPLSFKFLGSVEHPWKNQVYFLPMLAGNVPSGLMPGIAFYNHIVPAKRFSYCIAPMLATKGGHPVGVASVDYAVFALPRWFESINVGATGKRFVQRHVDVKDEVYHRIEPYLHFYVRPKNPIQFFRQEFILSSVIAQVVDVSPNYRHALLSSEVYNRLDHLAQWKHPVFKTSSRFRLEHHRSFIRASIELKETIKTNGMATHNVRFFGGVFLSHTTTNPSYNWRMDGQSAHHDYAFDGEFIDRSQVDEGMSRQVEENHGGFKMPIALGQSDQWIVAFNYKLRVKKLPFGLFGDAGFNQGLDPLADAGIFVPIVTDIVEIYFPLLYTKNIDQVIKANGLNRANLIRFKLDLSALNPLPYMRRSEIP